MSIVLCITILGLVIISVSNIVRFHMTHSKNNRVGLSTADIKWKYKFWIAIAVECVVVLILLLILGSIEFNAIGMDSILDVLNSLGLFKELDKSNAFVEIISFIASAIIILAAGIIGAVLLVALINLTLNIYFGICIENKKKIDIIYIVLLYVTTIVLAPIAVYLVSSGINMITLLV